MPRTKKYKINGDALRDEIIRSGISLREASNKIGCAESYLPNIIKRGEIPHNKCQVIEGALGIQPDKYVIPEPSEQEIKLPDDDLVKVLQQHEARLYALTNNFERLREQNEMLLENYAEIIRKLRRL